MRHVRLLVLTLLAALLAAPAVAAQTATTPATYTGLQYMASRQYAPNPGETMSQDAPVMLLSVRVLRFESADAATQAFPSLSSATDLTAQMPINSDDVKVEQKDVDDLGDEASVTTVAATNPQGDTGYFRMLTVRDGDLLYMLTAIASSEDAAKLADRVAAEMVKAEPSDADIHIAEDGTSTGGVWDVMPVKDADVLDGLVPFSDSEYVAPAQ